MPLADLDAQHWPALSTLLDEVLALPPQDRERFLDELGADAAAHRDVLRRLLAALPGETGGFLSSLPPIDSVPAAGLGAELAAGARVGPYLLLQPLGEGGMGTVWLAERADGTFKRKVALKLPRLTWARGMAERLARERDILATLEHPHIARLYDAGLDQLRRPYLALEYVEGEPVDAYARRCGLGVRDRLVLLRQTAAAVSFAHSRLVVHRDLKPSNILVTGDGQVRLLDFGIAKLMQGDQAHETQLTQAAGRALTLDYASPEQIRGEPIGTASDVYSLGVVAHELLTGVRPKRGRGGRSGDVDPDVATDAPPASSATSDATTRRSLRGDLDAVLNKALKTSAADRYATVDAFAQDLEAFLELRPVTARPDSPMYRLRRLIARRKLETAIVVAVVLALLGGAHAQAAVLLAMAAGSALALWQWRRALKSAEQLVLQNKRTQGALHRTAAVVEFLESLLDEVGDQRPVTGRELLARSEVQLERSQAEPMQRVSVLMTLASIYSSYGHSAKAESLIDQAVAIAASLDDRELKGQLLASQATFRRVRAPEESRRMLEHIRAEYADVPEAMYLASRALAFIAQNANDANAAVLHAEAEREWFGRAAVQSTKMQAGVLGNLAYSYSLAGRMEKALPLFEESLRRFEMAGAQDSAIALTVRNNLGLAALSSGDPRRALAAFEAVCASGAEHSPDGSPPLYALANRARALCVLDRCHDALTLAGQTVELAAAKGNALSEAHGEATRIDALRGLGRVEDAAARLAGALSHFAGKVPASAPPMLVFNRVGAALATQAGRFDEALVLLDGVIAQIVERGLRGAVVTGAYSERSVVRRMAGLSDAALADAECALTLAQAAQGGLPCSADTGLAALRCAEALDQLGRTADSANALALATANLVPMLGAQHPLAKAASALAAKRMAL